jgi:hypothetical protein
MKSKYGFEIAAQSYDPYYGIEIVAQSYETKIVIHIQKYGI